MKNLTKKLLTLLVAVLMIFTSSVHVGAATNQNVDQTYVSISGLEPGATVNLYKINGAQYETTSGQFKDYVLNSKLINPNTEVTTSSGKVAVSTLDANKDGQISAAEAEGITDETEKTNVTDKYLFDMENPTEAQINTIAKNISTIGTLVPTVSGTAAVEDSTITIGDKGVWKKNAYAKTGENTTDSFYDATGQYIAIINAPNCSYTLYSPVLLSVGYETINKTYTVDAEGTHYKLKDGTYTTTEPTTETQNNYESITIKYKETVEKSDALKPGIVDLNDKNSGEWSTGAYKGTNGTAKKQNPDFDKSAEGGVLTDTNVPTAVLATNPSTGQIVEGFPTTKKFWKAGVTAPLINAAFDSSKNFASAASEDELPTIDDEGDLTTQAAKINALVTTDAHKALTTSELKARQAGAGDRITYTINANPLPDYPENSKNKTLFFSDTMESGLDFEEGSLTVSFAGNNPAVTKSYDSSTKKYVFKIGTSPNEKEIATASEQDNGFMINYNYDNLPDETGKKKNPVMKYTAIVTTTAVEGLPGNTNEAKMVWAKHPDQGSTWNKDNEEPSGEDYNKKYDNETVFTYQIELIKTNDEDKYLVVEESDATHVLVDGVYLPIDEKPAEYAGEYYIVNTAYEKLAGAVFGIYKDSSCSELVTQITTNENGYAITSLDGPGTYWIKELKAPTGYSLDSTPKRVDVTWRTATRRSSSSVTTNIYTAKQSEAIDPTQVGWLKAADSTGANGGFISFETYPADTTFDEQAHRLTLADETTVDGIWKAYLKETTTTTASETTETIVNNNGGTVFYGQFKDTDTPELPSTGGIGTYLFTIAGVAIIATAAFMLIFRKKEGHTH